ncbi:DJ-1/YajL/PfpI superfamily [Streptococcus sp. DD10]|uniref:DJ-1 family glyoxalase III n=1 Tax=Streptococcus sp. DD10 TaxID=1777878 RepID=UPI00079C8C55|nr:DJ-1 family glyoxalase III [Streptococcus sp. DD10]KXT74100.1 DJ-1/YajL/PfpI superfamily [Streptococcus sp. DD10]
MKKVALLLATGFEEIEALTVVDVLRRASISCDMIGFENEVTGSHGICIQVDRLFEVGLHDYDMLVLPGGMPGATNLRDNPRVIETLKQFELEEKYIAAICAAPIVLDQAGILKGKSFTCYDSVKEQISDGIYQKETVVKDRKLITSRGPATALAFSYELVTTLGGDAESLRDAMLYRDVFGDCLNHRP